MMFRVRIPIIRCSGSIRCSVPRKGPPSVSNVNQVPTPPYYNTAMMSPLSATRVHHCILKFQFYILMRRIRRIQIFNWYDVFKFKMNSFSYHTLFYRPICNSSIRNNHHHHHSQSKTLTQPEISPLSSYNSEPIATLLPSPDRDTAISYSALMSSPSSTQPDSESFIR